MNPRADRRLLVINDTGLRGGGAENRLTHLVEYWANEKKWESITVLSLGIKAEQPTIAGVHFLTARNETHALGIIGDMNEPPSLAQVHNVPRLGTPLFTALKERAVPVVWFVHDFWPLCARNLLHDRWGHRCHGPELVKCALCVGARTSFKVKLQRDDFRAVDLAIPQTRSVQRVLSRNGIQPRQWMPLTPWIDLTVFSPRDEETKGAVTLVFAGPLSKAKGADLALYAFASILKSIPEARLRMIGGEPHHGNWAQELADGLGITASVSFEGRLSHMDLAAAFRQSTLSLFTSSGQEPFGLTWAQSMACGCPPVLARTQSITECLGGSDALLASLVCDARPDAIAASAVRLLTNRALRTSVRNESITFACKKFNIATAALALDQAYSSLMESP